MKVFITFLGIVILNMTVICYHSDLANYIKLSNYLKQVAIECAAGSSQYYDEEAYSIGKMVINEEEAVKYVDYIVGLASERVCLKEGSDLTWEMIIDNENENPNVTVKLTLEMDDLFRLKLIDVSKITASSKYELVGY